LGLLTTHPSRSVAICSGIFASIPHEEVFLPYRLKFDRTILPWEVSAVLNLPFEQIRIRKAPQREPAIKLVSVCVFTLLKDSTGLPRVQAQRARRREMKAER